MPELPKFQALQRHLTAHIRDPENSPYDGMGVEIEPRRLLAYQELFYNNVFDFFSNLFVVLVEIVGEERFGELVREYMQKHQAHTPLFHELGQEFIAFLQTEYSPKPEDPDKDLLLALAQYEWLELAVAIDPAEAGKNPASSSWNWSQRYTLSPVAWLVDYPWPVHRLDVDTVSEVTKAPKDTFLLLYRDGEDEVQFMELSPLLYALVQVFVTQEGKTAEEVVTFFAKQIDQPVAQIQAFSEPLLLELFAADILLV